MLACTQQNAASSHSAIVLTPDPALCRLYQCHAATDEAAEPAAGTATPAAAAAAEVRRRAV